LVIIRGQDQPPTASPDPERRLHQVGALPEPELTSRPAWIAQIRTTADIRTVVLADRDWEYGLPVDGIAVLRAAGPGRRAAGAG
jgi:hypothetical protein